MTRKRERNPNWKGGRTITEHGYVLIRVGTKHHLADIRGYAYEHRLVAEKKLGRQLQPGEQIHHVDGDRQNNMAANLVVAGSVAGHRVLHRGEGCARRLPNEPNPTIECRCGCRQSFDLYDQWGRSRQYVSGHNPQPASLRIEILRVLKRGSIHRNQLARLCDRQIGNIATTLSTLKKEGVVCQLGRGVWGLKEQANEQDEDKLP